MEMHTCKTCGGSVSRVGNHYICEFCGNKWEIDSGDDIHAVDRANAWSALRNGDFEKATELFENILVKETDNHEAYWGRALALGGIVYVTDLNENKKVPTCNNITEESFLSHRDVKKAISLAPAHIAESYQQQAAYIEKVRIEWIQKASKEPAYDVFISFKDSDRENGIERTQDSIDAQDLYNALIAEGYKVFFSRISLRDKVSEQYEPYIYNAIKTAKVMIVFCEKAEYFSSVWIKNEWSRFKTRIEKGEKHKNSLVVVYKHVNPGDLPVVLRTRQCLNAADMTFLPDLYRHIKRVIEETQKTVHIEKIKIEGGQIAKKATTLSANAIQTRAVGQGAIAETSVDEKQSLGLVEIYMKAGQWERAKVLIEDILFENPTCAEAILYSIFADRQSTTVEALCRSLPVVVTGDIYTKIEKTLDCASKPFAQKLLKEIYQKAPNATPAACAKLLKTILPYQFDSRQACISAAFDVVISKAMTEPFEVLLTTLEASQVDLYINYHLKFAAAIHDDLARTQRILLKVLAVDEGNLAALRRLAEIDLRKGTLLNQMKASFEKVLAFSSEQDKEIEDMLNLIEHSATKTSQYQFAVTLLQYYSKDISPITGKLTRIAQRAVNSGYFEIAENLLKIVLTQEQGKANVLWLLCMIKIGAKSEQDIPSSDVLLADVPEYKKYLTLVSESRRMQCIDLEKQQQDYREKCIREQQKKIDGLAAERVELLKTRAAIEPISYKGPIISAIFAILLMGEIPVISIGLIIGGGIFLFASIRENRASHAEVNSKIRLLDKEIASQKDKLNQQQGVK